VTGATIRKATVADATAIAEAHVATWHETYRGLLPDSYLDSLTPAGREPQWRQILALPNTERCVLVATGAAETIVGFASGGPARGSAGYAGEIYTLYLRRAYQGCGLGRALFAALAAQLRDRDNRSLILWVLATNRRARGFYEALGGEPLREQAIIFDGISLREVGYGWRDTDAIVQAGVPSDEH
jgi:ribosomal protein S18 acetylase RimI-like enzyme